MAMTATKVVKSSFQPFRRVGAAKFSSRCLKLNRLIKSATATASLMTEMQGSAWTAAGADDGQVGAPPQVGDRERLHSQPT